MPTVTISGDPVMDTNAYSTITKIVVDDDGSIYGVGYFHRQVSFGGQLLQGPTTPNVINGFVVAYDSFNAFKWLIHIKTDLGSGIYGLDLFSSASVDKRIVISGYYKGENPDHTGNGVWLPTSGLPLTLPSSSITKSFVAYLDSDGLALALNGVTLSDSDPILAVYAFRCVVDKSNDDVIVSGTVEFPNSASPITVDFGSISSIFTRPANTPGKDSYLVFYNSAGNATGILTLNTGIGGRATIADLALDGDDIYVTGGWIGSMTPGPSTLTTAQLAGKYFALQYSKSQFEFANSTIPADGTAQDASYGSAIFSNLGQVTTAVGYTGALDLGTSALNQALPVGMNSYIAVARYDAALSILNSSTTSIPLSFPTSININLEDPSRYWIGGFKGGVPRIGVDTSSIIPIPLPLPVSVLLNVDPATLAVIDQSPVSSPESWIVSLSYNPLTGTGAASGNRGNVANAEITLSVQPCLRQGTKVSIIDVDSVSRKDIAIEELKPGDLLLGFNGEYMPLLSRIELPRRSLEFVHLPAGSAGNSEDLFIRPGHPILFEGQEVPCDALVGIAGIKICHLNEPERIYTLCTENKNYVMMQNVPIATWSQTAWRQFSQENFIYHE